MIFSRKQAQMIAEELYKKIRSEVVEVAQEIARDEIEEFICLKDAARMVGVSPSCMYKKKDKFGCYTKIGGRIRFSKSRLSKVLQTGIS